MFPKSFISYFFVGAVIVAGYTCVFAQTAPVSGTVELKKDDGTREPVVGALIEAYRIDIKAGAPSTHTNKKGEFVYAGLQFVGIYTFAISAPGCAPIIFPNVKAGQEKLLITMAPGNGNKFTEDEVRNAAAADAKSGNNGGEMSAADKKAKEDYDKKVAENQALKKKADDSNKIINAALKDGATAFQAQNYDLAIAKFDEGYNADPDFEGSAPIMLTNKGLALRERGIATYRQAATGDDAAKATALEKAKADFAAAVIAFQKAIQIVEKAPTGDPSSSTNLARNKTDALRGYIITTGVIAKLRTDPEKDPESLPILDKYLAAETDDQKKMATLMNWSNYMREAGDTKLAIHGYRIILEKSPENIDAWAGIGLSLFAEGVASTPENKEQEQEGLNYMQKFADTAPDSHPLKASVKESVDYLKNTAKLAPQKVTTTKKKP